MKTTILERVLVAVGGLAAIAFVFGVDPILDKMRKKLRRFRR